MMGTVVFAAGLLLAPPPAAAEPWTGGPRVCAALSGGGARGLAHIGVLQALEAEGVPIHCVAGTSMGALVGSLYAAGVPPSEMQEIVRSVEWRSVFSGRPDRTLIPLALRMDDARPVFRAALRGLSVRLPAARDSDYRTNRLLFRLLADPAYRIGDDFDRLRVPFRAVATDLASGERVVLARGSLVRAVRASLGTPVNLRPVRWEGRLLVDGGLVDNLPVGPARSLGADVVVAVDVQSPLLKPRPQDSFVDTTALVIDVLLRARNEQLKSPADVEIDLRPALGTLHATEYERQAEAIEIGRRQGREGAAQAAALARSASRAVPTAAGNGGASDGAAGGPALEGVAVGEVVVRGAGRIREDVVRRAFALEPGRPFAMADALRGMDEVYATRLFDSVWLDVARGPAGAAALAVEVQEAPRVTVEVGGGYDAADQARGFLRFRNRNLFGRGERSDTTLVASHGIVGVRSTLTSERPLGLPVGIFARGLAVEEKPRFFAGHDHLGRAEFDRRGVAAGLQHGLGLTAIVRGGLAVETTNTRERAGVPLSARRDRVTLLLGEAAWDTLDDPDLPSRGAAARVRAERGLGGLGATVRPWRVRAHVEAAATPVRRLVFRAQGLWALSGGDLPVYQQTRLGGPVWIPGFQQGELWGAQALAGSFTAGVAVHRQVRVLARLGAGNVWETRGDVRLGDLVGGFGVGLEVPTRAGPIVVDWGRSVQGTSRFQVTLGFPWADPIAP
jgi:NTE family protein